MYMYGNQSVYVYLFVKVIANVDVYVKGFVDVHVCENEKVNVCALSVYM